MISIIATHPSLTEQAQTLASRIQLPFSDETDAKHMKVDYALQLTLEGLQLQACGRKAPGPVWVDFTGGKSAHRREFGGGRGQSIAKAVGLKQGRCPSVLDVTAGLGGDAFVLASLGCTVKMLERQQVVAELLEDGLCRAQQDYETADIAANMSLFKGAGLDFLHESTEMFDVVYLDPMFPHSGKSAQVKKEMQLFRELVGKDTDADALFEPALAKAIYRLVVKRPRLAPYLNDMKPTFELAGKANRFDIYVNKGLASANTE
jgi:16S rRNA (guanine1516-N2)-methyltransferase